MFDFVVYEQIDGPITKNLFKFQVCNSTGDHSINSSIHTFYLSGYKLAVDEHLINSLVFENVRTIILQGSFGSIETDVFKSLQYLSEIEIESSNLMNFFHQFGIEWTLCLQENASVLFSNLSKKTWFQAEAYDYPSEDFCLFAAWPHEKLALFGTHFKARNQESYFVFNFV
jgi:hypothetical protein